MLRRFFCCSGPTVVPTGLPLVLSSTLPALLGALPLALEQGTGSELRRPMGIAIVGGLILSQTLTLYTTPVIYLYMDRLSKWVRQRRTAAGMLPIEP